MTKNKSLQLNVVQKKVLDELEILTDVMASTFLEIGSVIRKFSKEIFESKEISKLEDSIIKKNTSWLIRNQNWDVSYFPFIDSSDSRNDTIGSLGQIFCITGRINLKRGLLSKKTSGGYRSWIEWGFKFKYDEKNRPTKFFYVEIEIEKTPDGAVFSKEEYLNIANKIQKAIDVQNGHFFELDYPDNGGKERFYVWLDLKYSESLSRFFDNCKDELIKEFLSRIANEKNLKSVDAKRR